MRAVRRSEGWSRALLALGALVTLVAGLVGYLNATLVNGDRFAELVNQIRQDEQVKATVGQAIADAAIDAQPDLVAIEPALDAAAALVVGSPLLDPVFTPAIRSFHQALTEEGGSNAVLALADLGATVTTVLERFVPAAAELIPADLNVTLAQFGGQQGLASRLIPLIQIVSTLAWVLPILVLLLIAAGLLVAPHRRIATVRLGWLLVAVGALLGVGALGMFVASALIDGAAISGAVQGAALAVFAQPLGVRAVAFLLVGGLTVAAAGALLPQVDVGRQVRAVARVVARRPARPGWAVARAMAIVAVGLVIVLFPSVSGTLVVVLVGLAVLVAGIAELDRVAEEQRARDEAQTPHLATGAMEPGAPRRGSARWLIPVAAGAVGLILVGTMIVPDQLPQSAGSTGATDPDACNGHVQLCERPFDQVALPATHNSMSVADGTWFLAEQPKDMVSSLDDGIRALLVDTWYGQPTEAGGAITADRSVAAAEAELTATYGPDVVASIRRTIDRVRRSEPSGPVEPYFCHTVCEIGATPMAPEMRRLAEWMAAHPREVVVLFIQDTVTPADTDVVLRAAGLAELAYAHTEGAPWPTLRQMVDSGKRLLVLMENHGGGADYPYLHQGFDLVQDTPYTFQTAADFTCTPNRGSPQSPLLLVNHWLASFTRLVSNAQQVNAYDVLKPRVEQCVTERGKVPNLIAVNWYDHGDLFRVVDELNGVSS